MGVAGGDSSREMAESTTIIRVPVGSTVHGLALEGTDDRDEMGVCVENIEGVVGFNEFEQYIYRTAAEREGKHDAPSQPGDLDLTIYSLRKYLRLAMQGNPTVLTLLFVPHDQWVGRGDVRGRKLQELAPLIISRQAGRRFLGYMEAQRQRLLGERGQKKVNRPDLDEKFGFDTKYAMHIIRLGTQGVELMKTGRMTLPMKEAKEIKAIRTGAVELNEVLQRAGELERELKDLISDGPLREHPDKEAVERWMIGTYQDAWTARGYFAKQLV